MLYQGSGFDSSQAVGTQTYAAFEKLDFSKPERYIREIARFLENVTLIPNNLTAKLAKSRSISANEAHAVIIKLLELMAPNLYESEAPPFKAPDIQHLFATLHCPYTIRADAITAVGAPSSVGFLMRAIYWLYLVVRTYYGRPEAVVEVSEEDQEEGEEQKSIEANDEEIESGRDQVIDEQSALFRRILDLAES